LGGTERLERRSWSATWIVLWHIVASHVTTGGGRGTSAIHLTLPIGVHGGWQEFGKNEILDTEELSELELPELAA